MKEKTFYPCLFLAILMLISGCGSETGTPGEREIAPARTASDRAGASSKPSISGEIGSSESFEGFGVISVNITADSSTLPSYIRNLVVTCDDFSIYEAREGWRSLPLATSSFTVDLFGLSGGKTINLIPPVKIPPGQYKNIRIGVTSATIRTWRGEHPVNIPPYSLRTIKGVDFKIGSGETVDLTLDLDLSRTLVDYGSRNFVLNPAFNIVETQKAAAVSGYIKLLPPGSSRGPHGLEKVVVAVYCDHNNNFKPDYGEDYTKIRIRSYPSSFCIYWLGPHKNYIVSIQADGREIYSEVIEARNLPAGKVFKLNNGKPI